MHLVSSSPSNPALLKALHEITETEPASDKDLQVELQSAGPSGVGFDDDMYEYELLDNLEFEEE